MGADMIGHMFRGPIKLDPRAVEAATQEAAARIQSLGELRRLVDQLYSREDDTPPVQGIVDEAELREKIAELLRCDLDCYTPNDTPDAAEQVLEAWEPLLDLNAETVVKEFVEFWEGGGYRDAVYRVFPQPDGTAVRVVFAGDMSWGDEPTGAGYQIMNVVEDLHITATLGLD